MSSPKPHQKSGSGQIGAVPAQGPREPRLTQLSGAGAIVRFNADWAAKCASSDTLASFVSLFEENVLPAPRAVMIEPASIAHFPEEMRNALIMHAAKKFVDATAEQLKLNEKVYQKYWMSLSLEWQNRFSGVENFAAVKQAFDVLALKTMLETAFNTPATAGDPHARRAAVEAAMTAYQNASQFEREAISAYYRRFAQVLVQVDAVVEAALRPSAEMRVTRFLSSLNRRDSVYTSKLEEQAALSGEDIYPVSLEDALAKASAFLLRYYSRVTSNNNNHTSQPNATVFAAATGGKSEEKKDAQDIKDVVCFRCGQKGHYRNKCTAEKATVHSLVVSEEFCQCGVTALDTFNMESSTLYSAIASAPATASVRVKSDTCAEVSVVGEGFPIQNLRECAPLVIEGVGGSIVVSMAGTFGPLDPVYYHRDFPVNILAFGSMEDVADITYFAGRGFSVRFHGEEGEYFFEKGADNTYACYIPTHKVMDATIADREKTYTKAEIKRARGVRDLKLRLAGASDRDLIEFISGGVALNNPFTPEDVRRAAAIYGPDIACLKGKMTSPSPERPLVVRVDHGEQRQQELHVDIFEVSGSFFLLSIMLPMRYTFATYVAVRTTEELTSAVSGLLRVIQAKGFVITKIVVDPETGLTALGDTLPVTVDPVGPGTHVPRAERRGRVVKERMRTVLSALPFRVATRFVKYLVFFVVTRLNLIPQSSDGSKICPRERFTGQKVVFGRDFELCFGDTVQVFTQPAVLNSMSERCASAMALYPTGNDQGSWKFVKLGTGTVVTGSKWTKVPLQDVQIKLLNAMADEDAIEIGRGKKAKTSMTRVQTLPGQVPLERMMVNAHQPIPTVGFADGAPVGGNFPVEPAAPPAARAGGTDDNVPLQVGDIYEGDLNAVMAPAVDQTTEDDDAMPDMIEDDDDEDPPEDNEHGAIQAPVLGRTEQDDGTRVSARLAARRTPLSVEVHKLSVAQAIDKYGELAKRATLEEFVQMREKVVLQLMQYADLTPAQRERVIHSSLFLKEKYGDNGDLERIKARLVASGNEMNREMYGSGSSPTVATEAVFVLLAQSAAHNEVRYFVDIGTAFLEAPMVDEDVYMWISKSLVPYLIEAMPEAAAFVDQKGRVMVRLLKALYGCIQSSRLWYEHIRDILLRGGFKANDYDSCVFHKGVDGARCSAALHVDDLFITASTDALAQELLDLLRASLKEVKVKSGVTNTYLGMRVVDDMGCLKVDMDHYVHDCVEWYGADGTAKTPADGDLFKIDSTSPAQDKPAREKFHTGTAKLLYVAKRCRPDVLTAVSFLCSRVTKATAEDSRKLERVMKYLRGTPNRPMLFRKGSNTMDLFAFVDAGYGVHETGESRTGLVVTLNGTPVLCKTNRQHIVTKSSTEAELVALSDALTDILWCREFIMAAGFDIPATRIGEDNKSVLALLEERKFGTARTKHISVRYFFICDRIARGELVMEYVPTAEMLADILSKDLIGHQFQVLQPRLHGDAKA